MTPFLQGVSAAFFLETAWGYKDKTVFKKKDWTVEDLELIAQEAHIQELEGDILVFWRKKDWQTSQDNYRRQKEASTARKE